MAQGSVGAGQCPGRVGLLSPAQLEGCLQPPLSKTHNSSSETRLNYPLLPF